MKSKSSITYILIIAGVFFVTLFWMFKSDKSEFDLINKENSKMVDMSNIQMEQALRNYTQSVMYPGYIEESGLNAKKYLSTIKSIEKYTRYGVMSRKSRNNVYLKIVFNNGKIIDDVYTGETVNGILGASLLIRVYLKDGKVFKVETNGVEKKGAPDWVTNDLYNLFDDAIGYDRKRNPTDYFPPEKTSKDFEKEWENL